MSPIGVSTLVRVLEAGIEVFAQDGPFAAGTLEIAGKAGVAESTIFRRFDTKENLFRECFRTAIARSLDPAQFQALISYDRADAGFAKTVQMAVQRWYASMPVNAARLVLFTSLSHASEWRALGSERINQIIAILAERVELEARKRRTRNLDANAASISLISSLLYLKSTRPSAKDRGQRTAETFIRQWMFGLFPE
jgi:AcrR family transcriptional regulator